MKISQSYNTFHYLCIYCNIVWHYVYSQTSNIKCTLVGNKFVDHSDVIGALPVTPAPTTSSFSTKHRASMDWAKTTTRPNKKHLSFGIGVTYIIGLRYVSRVGYVTILL